MTDLYVNEIIVGPRMRTADPAKVAGLAESIAELGLLQPITVTTALVLVAGLHRLEAHKLLGLSTIAAQILDLDDLHAELAQIDENLIRDDLTVLERGEYLARRKEVYEEIHPEARHGGDRKASDRSSGNNFHLISFSDDTATKTGTTARTVRQEVQIANDITADVRADLHETTVADRKVDLLKLARLDEDTQREVADMIIDGEAKTVPQAIKMIRDREKITRPLPTGTFQVIYADPPWQYDNSGFNEAAEGQYPTMPLADICALPVAELASNTSILFLWATNPLLTEALQVMSAWGFTYKTNMAWIKDQGRGKGWYLRSKHELLLIGVRKETPPPVERPDSCFEADRGPIHSRKPERAYEIIESMYPGSKIELFGRVQRPGWDTWGNEVMS